MTATYQVRYPFVHSTYEARDEEGIATLPTWKPGTRYEMIGPEEGGEFADGLGWMRLVEISRHKPGKYPERVFYTRSFVDPDGRSFGNQKLRMTTAAAFRRLCDGYRVPFVVPEPRDVAAEVEKP